MWRIGVRNFVATEVWQVGNAAFVGPVFRLSEMVSQCDFTAYLREGFHSAFKAEPSPAELAAWRASLPVLVSALCENGFGDLHILVEYRLPFDSERCDVVLLGAGAGGELVALVIELKQWTQVELYGTTTEMVYVPGVGLCYHPSYQAANYAGKIKNFHSLAGEMRVEACAFAHNVTEDSGAYESLFDGRFEGLMREAPLFTGSTEGVRHMLAFISSIVFGPADPDKARAFCNGRYVQSLQFLDGLARHLRDIRERVSSRILGAGWGLTEDQLRLKCEVLDALESGVRVLFLVQGVPGSGKSLLAVHLLLESMRLGRQAVLGMVNNRLMSALRNCMDRSYRGSSGTLKYFTGRLGSGLSDGPPDQRFDIVVCDEGQRMAIREMKPILGRGRVVVVFYDEFQRLLPSEQGTRENFLEVARELGLAVRECGLMATCRCRGGLEYQRWVEALLSDPRSVRKVRDCGWARDYDFRVFDSLAQMVAELRGVRQAEARDVCVLASFTESDGRADLVRTEDPRLLWAMSGKEYVDFWVNRRSNDLERCASVYGCQGFERAYCGVIWGKDYVLRGDRWVVHERHTITDYIGKPSLRQLVERGRYQEALSLLYNRYRILLTRGIQGTFVFCEDAETRAFLREIAR